MTESTLVTIAIPIYNAEKFLDFAILSVLNQTYKNWELLLMEDGSIDHSEEISQKYATLDPRIRIVSDGANKGLICRLNQSISLAKGKYYARMDADDIMAIDRIEKQVAFMETNQDTDVIGSSTMLIDESNNILGSRSMDGNSSGFIHPSVFGKTEWFLNNQYRADAYRVEDQDLWYRTQTNSKFVNLPEPLMFYRAFGTSSSYQTFVSNKRQRKLFKNYKDYGYSFWWFLKKTFMSYVRDIIYLILPLVGGNKVFDKIRLRNPVANGLCLNKQDLEKSISITNLNVNENNINR